MASANVRVRRAVAALAATLLAGLPAGFTPAPAAAASAVVVVGANAYETSQIVERAGGDIGRVLDVVGGVSARLTAREVRSVVASGLQVVPDAEARVTSTGFDKHGNLVQLDALNPAANDASAGSGVGVALLDTGVAPSPEFADRVITGPDLSGENDGVDRFGHGTFMAGLIVGSETGVAPGAHVVSVKVAGRDGITSLSNVLDAMDFVIETRDETDTRILSMSLAVEAIGPWFVDPLAIATEVVTASGILVVTASGNQAGTVSSPGIAPSALTVGASDHNDTATQSDDVVTPWSGSLGTKPEVLAPGAGIISVRAPGSTIDAAYPAARIGDRHFRGSGTSMSTALTAGAAAVVAEQAPDATPAELKSMIVSGSRPIAGGRAVDLRGAERVAADLTSVPLTPVIADGSTVTWTGTRWAGTRWAGTRWAGTRWAGTRWAGTRWAGTRWAGTRWAGTRWAGTRWAGTRWAGTRWAGTRWAGTRWAAADFGVLSEPT